MAIDKNVRVDVAPNVFTREFEGELVVLDLEGGDYYGLDALGRQLWEGLTRGKSPAEVAAEVAAEFDVALPTVEADFTNLTKELLERKLLVARG
jgi:hypothetical protein